MALFKKRFSVLMIFAVALMVTAGILAFRISNPPASSPAASAVGGPFSLIDQNGNPFTEKNVKGAPHLVFFGFTHCPDICPTKLLEMSEILKVTGEKGKNIKVLFVSVDPERDTPAKLKDYLSNFDARITGLSGDAPALQQMIKNFKAYAKKVPLENGGYTMDHTALVYLMDKQGRFVNGFNLDRPPEQGAKDLLNLL